MLMNLLLSLLSSLKRNNIDVGLAYFFTNQPVSVLHIINFEKNDIFRVG